MIYQIPLTPDATLEVEDSANVVLVTPERRVTITNVQEWIDQLEICHTLARIADAEAVG